MTDESLPHPSDINIPVAHLRLIVGFTVCFILSATFFQLRSRTVPWLPGSPVEYFTGSMLWILSLVCLLLADDSSADKKRSYFWLSACGALLFLAFDEWFELHEFSERWEWFDDDYIKIIQFLGAIWALNYIRRREKPSKTATRALVIGLLFQCLHILVEVGDGFLFKFPIISKVTLKWCEEFSELFFLSSYLVGFFLLHKYPEKARRQKSIKTETIKRIPGPHPPTNKSAIGFLFAFILLCASFLQLSSSIPPGTEGAPIDFFTSRVLWMLALVCLLIAHEKLPDQFMALFWLAACASIALLAMDEIFAFHERSRKLLGDDDHVKIISVLLAAGVLYAIQRLEKPPRSVYRLMLIGFLFHTLWLLVDIGDGDYYRLPLGRTFRLWAEEYFELLALSTYLAGFLSLYGIQSKHSQGSGKRRVVTG